MNPADWPNAVSGRVNPYVSELVRLLEWCNEETRLTMGDAVLGDAPPPPGKLEWLGDTTGLLVEEIDRLRRGGLPKPGLKGEGQSILNEFMDLLAEAQARKIEAQARKFSRRVAGPWCKRGRTAPITAPLGAEGGSDERHGAQAAESRP